MKAMHGRASWEGDGELGELVAFYQGEINTLVLGLQSASQVLLASYPSSF